MATKQAAETKPAKTRGTIKSIKLDQSFGFITEVATGTDYFFVFPNQFP